jgi:hypothetical protein
MAPPPPPPPPPPAGGGRPSDVLVVGVVVVDSVVVVRVVVVAGVVVEADVVTVLGGVFVVDGDGVVPLGELDCELLPQCWAFPLPLLLPQLPLLGFPPLPGLPVSVLSGFSSALAPEPPSASPFGPLPGPSSECEPPGRCGGDEGSAMAKAPPRPHRNRPEATTQADAAPSTREPKSYPSFKASPADYLSVSTILAQSCRDDLLCIAIYSPPGQPGAVVRTDDIVGLHHRFVMNGRRVTGRPAG